MFIRKRVLRFGFDQLIRDVLPSQGLPHSNSPLINTVQSPSINYSASDVAVIPQFNSGTFGFHRNRSFPLPPSILLFPKPVESARFARSFRRAVPRDRPAKLETRSSLGSPLYKYHTLLSASRLVAREHRGERGGGGRGEEESRLRGPLRSVPRSRGPHRPSPVLSVAPATLWTKFIFSIIPTLSFDETSIDRVSFNRLLLLSLFVCDFIRFYPFSFSEMEEKSF